jgi:hypothetical protein
LADVTISLGAARAEGAEYDKIGPVLA